MQVAEQVAERAAAYSGDRQEPLQGYAAAVGAFTTALLGAVVLAERSGRLPERVPASDVVLVGIASHKVARLVARARVTAFVRAPFTRRARSAGHGEVDDLPRDDARVLGGLLVCPYCLGLWVASGLTLAVALAPRPARVVCAAFAADVLADSLQSGYRTLIDAAPD